MSESQQSVIIIGAGIIGLMSALELLQQGYRVKIFDQAEAAKGASWAGGGILSPMYPWKYDPAVNLLAQHGKRLYKAWNQKLLPISQIDFEIEEVGLLIFDQDQYEQGLNYHQQFSEPDQFSELLTQQQLQRINPKVAENIESALYFPHLANIRNPRLTQSIVKYLTQHAQVEIYPHTAIKTIHQNDRAVFAVEDQYGKKHQADHYVLASGAWSKPLLSQLAVEFEVSPVQGQMVLYKTPAKWLPTLCMNDTMYLIPRRDGHIVCGSSMRQCGFDTTVDATIAENIVDTVARLVPEIVDFPIVKQWAGLRPSSPNGVPRIGKVPHLQNMWLNVGHYRNGLVMAPASAQLLVQQMQDQPTLTDPKLFLPISAFERVSA